MKRSLVLVLCLMCGCASAPPANIDEDATPKDSAIETVPSELSIEHFSHMRLAGTGFTLDDTLTDNAVYTRYAASYRSNGLKITGILNVPKGAGPHPLLVLNHGYIDPKVYTIGRGLKREQDYLAREGFAVFHSDYRGHAGSDKSPDERKIYDAAIEYSMDVLDGIEALRAAQVPGIDMDRIGMLGHSMGGGVTQNILVSHPDVVSAAVLYAPVHGDAWENFFRWRAERDSDDRTADLGTPEENPEAWKNLSASTYYDRIETPVLLFHGDKDADVPVAWSDTLAQRLTLLGKDIEYVKYPGEKHEFGPRWNDFMKTTSAFFREHLIEDSWTSPLPSARVTLKSFGTYVTPNDSPVPNERFSGFHTGWDFELDDAEVPHDVIIIAACDGPLLEARTVSGYGGVAVQRCTFDGEDVTALYGHLQLSSVKMKKGDMLSAGDAIGVLGAAHSDETDGERAHLHFSLHKGSAIEWKGYVSRKEALADWIDPEDIF